MKIKFEPRDIWIGLYWTPKRTANDPKTERNYSWYEFYLCPIPCVVIIWKTSPNMLSAGK